MRNRRNDSRHCVALAVCVLLLTACSDASSPASDTTPGLATLLLDQVPGDLTLNPAVSGPLSEEMASTATVIEPPAMAQLLTSSHFQGGFTRVWTRGAAYDSALLLALRTAAGATQLVGAERSYLANAGTVIVADDPAVPDAFAYSLYGQTRINPRNVFCQGEWLRVSRYAFGLLTCSEHPAGFDEVERIASLQYSRAVAQVNAGART